MKNVQRMILESTIKPNTLSVMSIQAPNQDGFAHEVTSYLGKQLGATAVFPKTIPWQERERLFDAGNIQVGWICGLPYVWKADNQHPPVELLAAPVMSASRYQNRPISFSDVIVRADSPFTRFADFRGARWVYNEPHSHSGYNLVAYYLAKLGEDWSYFNEVLASGAHQVSLGMVKNGRCDASAIDSTVLEIEFAKDTSRQTQFRIIETLGPSPITPWVIRKDVPTELKQNIRYRLLTMHNHSGGHTILAKHGVTRFAPITDKDYDIIRHMAQITAVQP